MIFDEDVIKPNAKYHVFVLNLHTEHFRVAKFAALYNTEAEVSFIRVNNQFEIPGIAKLHKLRGKALFINEDFILSRDVAEFLDSIKGNYIVYADLGPERDKWGDNIIFNLDIPRIYNLLPLDKARIWKPFFLHRFQWISRKDDILDMEVGPLPSLDTFLAKKDSVLWWKEYLMFIKHILEPEVRRRLI